MRPIDPQVVYEVGFFFKQQEFSWGTMAILIPRRSQKERPPEKHDQKCWLKHCMFCCFGTLGYVREHTEFEGLLPQLMPRSNLKFCVFSVTEWTCAQESCLFFSPQLSGLVLVSKFVLFQNKEQKTKWVKFTCVGSTSISYDLRLFCFSHLSTGSSA